MMLCCGTAKRTFMDVSFLGFFEQVFSNPVLLITVALTLGVIFVNGWTDAPNAIATCIATPLPEGADSDPDERRH